LPEDEEVKTVHRERAIRVVGGDERIGTSGVRVTHPERLVFPVPRVTKLEVVRYYESIAPAMLVHLRDRPLAVVRCPEGIQQECFFQKHIGVRTPAGARPVDVKTSTGVDTYVAVEKREAIAGMAQFGTIEFHTWGSTASRLERPDRVTIDLDPDPDVPWERLIEAAQLTREFIAELGLTGFLKTTGGKGLHVVAPIKPTRDWDTVKAFAQAVAVRLETAAPDRFTARMAKARRRGKIFIDYLRNARGSTAICAYSLRARAGAPVSMPLPWDALSRKKDLRGHHFNLRSTGEQLEWSQAAWKDYDRARATLTVASLRKLGIAASLTARAA
jgi:bifunctional non-homologous end joining protein LigD